MVKKLIKEGYSVKDSCKALGVSRSSYYTLQRHGRIMVTKTVSHLVILEKIKSIKTEHPFWGYRRVTAWLRHREGFLIPNFPIIFIHYSLDDLGLVAVLW